jgi:DNA-directed RNA polymerase specialized sigma24 family protein
MSRVGRFRFETTRWSLILALGAGHSSSAREALAALLEAYWYPLYGFVRRRGSNPDDAQDSVQSFILFLLERDDLQAIRPERGRFRSFLLVSLRNFLENRRVHDRALKRGAGQPSLSLEFNVAEDRYLREPAEVGTPETIFDQNWALAVLDRVFQRIRADWEATGSKCAPRISAGASAMLLTNWCTHSTLAQPESIPAKLMDADRDGGRGGSSLTSVVQPGARRRGSDGIPGNPGIVESVSYRF